MPVKSKKTHRASASRRSKKAKAPIVGIGAVSNQPAPEFFNQRRQLMWLGVSISALVIFLLWLFSWPIGFPAKPAKSQPTENDAGQLVSDFQQAIDEAKSSLNNIGQLIEQTKANDSIEPTDPTTETLKAKIMEQLEEQAKEIASTTNEDGEKIIIFE
ncbi:MAG: hypothetical protein V1684_00275 [bacterium]